MLPFFSTEVEPVAKRRGKRGVSAKKAGRLAALERLKQSKESGKKLYDGVSRVGLTFSIISRLHHGVITVVFAAGDRLTMSGVDSEIAMWIQNLNVRCKSG